MDLIVLSNEDRFESIYVENILVEIHFHKYSTLVKYFDDNTNEVYKYLLLKIIFDNGHLEKLIVKAKEIYNNHWIPNKEKKDICYWLTATKIKLLSAINSNNVIKVSYWLSTNTWKVLDGV